jgi:hypothetical protein
MVKRKDEKVSYATSTDMIYSCMRYLESKLDEDIEALGPKECLNTLDAANCLEMPLPDAYRPNRGRWLGEHLEALVEMRDSGCSFAEIAATLNREENSCKCKYWALKKKEGNTAFGRGEK